MLIKRMPKLIKFLPMILFLFVFVGHMTPVGAQNLDSLIGLDAVDDELGLPGQNVTDDVKGAAVKIIKYLIGFLGIIATAIILYGGFYWMTAAGNDDRVKKAKSIIVAGVIGLVVVLSSYAIVSIVATIANQAVNGDI